MRIDRENIEEWMFKYHEGVLSEAHKKQVLAYIAMDEALTEEFRLWSITKLVANPSSEYPDLSQKLLKKDPFYQTAQFKSVSYFLLGAMLTGMLCWWLWGQTSAASEQRIAKKIEGSVLKGKWIVDIPQTRKIKVFVSPKASILHKAQTQTEQAQNSNLLLDTLEERWTAEPIQLNAMLLQDSTERPAFDQRRLTYPKRKLIAKGKTVKPQKKRRINLKRQWKFKEDDANF